MADNRLGDRSWEHEAKAKTAYYSPKAGDRFEVFWAIISTRRVRVRIFAGRAADDFRDMMPCTVRVEMLVRRLAYIVGRVGPLTALPQAVSIWVSHQAAGVSFCSAVGFTAVAAIWLAYGIVLRQGPIVLSSSLWVVFDLAIVSGVLRYGQIYAFSP
jgi:uncharacterized protein with PQ loop repeat